MKRTKESYYKYHPEWEQRQGVSGLKDFDGEDLGKIYYFFKISVKIWKNLSKKIIDFEARIKF